MRITLLGLLSVFLLGFLPHAFAFSNGQAASIVIGEPSFTAFDPGATSTGVVGPFALAFDSSGNLWVGDAGGNRVLEYKAPFSTHEAASVVIGQSSFTSLSPATTATGLSTPNGVAFDSSGNLWVVDTSNNRVLEYKAPFSTGEAASLVIGQSSFTVNDYTITNSTSLNSPYGLRFDSSGNLWVADLLNGRVLEYKAPFSTHEAASLVIGEPSFTAANDEVSKTGLNAPNSLAFDSSGDLWVVDGHRVLEYATPLITHEAATLVIGQNTFTNSSTATTTTGLNLPNGLAFDSSGNLWVADTLNDRVLQYKAPFSTFEAASVVIGQTSFTNSTQPYPINPTLTGLDQPTGIAFDSSGNLWVADWVDARVLEYGGSAAATISSSTTSTSAPSSTSSSSSTAPSTASSTSAASSTSTTSTSSTSTTSSASSSTTGGGGVPVYPYQVAAAVLFTVLLAASYLLVRRRMTIRGHASQDITTSG
jgi:sugar lactone lactonase YvrE